MRQIGIALQNFHNNHNHFPPSGQLPGQPIDIKYPVVGGWSFLVMILPYMDRKALYETLQIRRRSNQSPQRVSRRSTMSTTP